VVTLRQGGRFAGVAGQRFFSQDASAECGAIMPPQGNNLTK
jgi:hypothetical protein